MKTGIQHLAWILLLAAALLTPGCKDNSTNQNGSDIVFPASGVSYGKQVEPLFLHSCAQPTCHDQYTAQGGLNLETYEDLISASPPVVRFKDTTNSPLVWSIEKSHGLRIMPPPPLPPLNNNQITGIKRWILEGAQNN
ncbi:MAG: c-type cytochrome domain-containing protein [Bacteroidota bacterium]|jgi:hypothetical protein